MRPSASCAQTDADDAAQAQIAAAERARTEWLLKKEQFEIEIERAEGTRLQASSRPHPSSPRSHSSSCGGPLLLRCPKVDGLMEWMVPPPEPKP